MADLKIDENLGNSGASASGSELSLSSDVLDNTPASAPDEKPGPEKQPEKQNSPRPSPGNQKQPQPASVQSALEDYLRKMRKLFKEQKQRPEWQNNRSLRAVQKALSKDANLSSLLFKLYNAGKQFLNLPPAKQLEATKNVANHLKKIAGGLRDPQAGLTDLSNPVNMQRALENGNTVASQNAASQNGAVQAENNVVAEENLVEGQQQAENAHASSSMVAGGAAAVEEINLTESEMNEIEEYNQIHNNSTPSPKPNSNASQTNEEDHDEAAKLIKDEAGEMGAKHAGAEKDALKACLDGDKGAFMDAVKGIEKAGVDSTLEHAAGGALSSLVATAV